MIFIIQSDRHHLAWIWDRRKKLYSACSLGWTGSDNQWRHYTRGYLYLAALATLFPIRRVLAYDVVPAAGERYAEAILDNIDRSDLFVVFWSKSASQSAWVTREIDRTNTWVADRSEMSECTDHSPR